MKIKREVPVRDHDKPWMAVFMTFFAFGIGIGAVVVRAWDESEIDSANAKAERWINAAVEQNKTLCAPTQINFDTTSLTTQSKVEGSDTAGRIHFAYDEWTSAPTCVINASTTELDYFCTGDQKPPSNVILTTGNATPLGDIAP
jgi:hypothetical protein